MGQDAAAENIILFFEFAPSPRSPQRWSQMAFANFAGLAREIQKLLDNHFDLSGFFIFLFCRNVRRWILRLRGGFLLIYRRPAKQIKQIRVTIPRQNLHDNR